MIGVILCVLANLGLFTCFRLFAKYNLNTLQAITINYCICVPTGLIFIDSYEPFIDVVQLKPWVYIGVGVGVFFMLTFYLMALTTQKFSMTVATISSKMSLVIPVLSSLLILNIKTKDYTPVNYIGMAISVLAIVLSSYKPQKLERSQVKGWVMFLPVLIFGLGGFLDSIMNYTNHHYLTTREMGVFPIVIFSAAALMGLVSLVFKREKLALKSVIGGVVLGIINYFSIYCLLLALSSFNNDGAFVYPIINIGIIILAAGASVLFFKEHLSWLNRLGLLLAVLAILCISYQEIFSL